jgi:hypothetical protein
MHWSVTNWDFIWVEYIEISIMEWADEYKLCCIVHCRQNVVLWDTWYMDKERNLNKGVWFCVRRNKILNLIQRIMNDLLTSFHCEYQIANWAVSHEVKKATGLASGHSFLPLGVQCLRGEESTENGEVSLNLSVII